MKQITVRGVSPVLAKRLESLARAQGKSVNTLVLEILSAAAGVSERRERLARYTTWTSQDLKEFEHALTTQRSVDKELWK